MSFELISRSADNKLISDLLSTMILFTHTVWKVMDFPDTWILREINFDEIRHMNFGKFEI